MSLAHATRSELTKQFSTSIWWILALVLAAYLGVTAAGLAFAIAASDTGILGGATQGLPTGAGAASMLYSLASAVGYVFPLLIGTLLVTGEFRHKTLTPTFLATPRRGRVIWAKLIAGAIFGLLYAVLALVVTVGPAAGILVGFGLDTGLDSTDTWAMLARILLAFVLWAIIGIGVGLAVRNQVAAVVIVLAFTQFIEPLLRFAGAFVEALTDVARYLPGAASDTLVGSSIFTAAMSGTAGGGLEWWGGALVLLGYGVALTLIGYIAGWRRDVT
ncbi:ABC transporter permease [Microbacterium sp. cx-59]|uniref:ABC transporter permease n=1 Tax=Microbacterium sp. cx-59 TaxID=2891207 RepID=UPI001E42C35E|nr:ABC transporter permease [Microbacterium sp. cx-59]MCC4909331.1 ABC transporter permease [Microbacterium sp. cx-59]